MKPGSWIFGCSVLIVLCGCAASPPEHFYTLQPTPTSARDRVDPASAQRIAVNAVAIPQLVDRSEMVFQGDNGEVTISEQALWAEPLRIMIGRVVAANLSARIDQSIVAAYPEQVLGDATVEVNIVVEQWQVWRSGQIKVSALWEVSRAAPGGGAKAKVKEGRTVVETPGGLPGVAGALRAQDDALGQLSDAIAASIR